MKNENDSYRKTLNYQKELGIKAIINKRKSYSKDLKLGAINQVKTGKSISKVSKELGIIPTMLSRWIYEYEKEGINAFSGNGKKIQNKDYEIEVLKKEIEELKQDNEILKKYHAFLKEKK